MLNSNEFKCKQPPVVCGSRVGQCRSGPGSINGSANGAQAGGIRERSGLGVMKTIPIYVLFSLVVLSCAQGGVYILGKTTKQARLQRQLFFLLLGDTLRHGGACSGRQRAYH